MKEVRLKDIAQILGISVTTVSKALKGYKDVNEETRKSVIMLAENLNYKPNTTALNLKNRETRTIGLIIPKIVHPFFSSVIQGVIDEAEEKGYLVIILQSNESHELEKKQLEMLIDKRVDGILLALADGTITYDHLHAVMEKEIPIVLFDKVSDDVSCSKVTIDNKRAAYEAVNHLIGMGCRKIVHLRGPMNAPNAEERYQGYLLALLNNDISYDDSLVYECNGYRIEDGEAFAAKAFEQHPNMDGVFAITDHVAAGAIAFFNRNGIKVPEQVAVIGFSNSPLTSIITPSLSTVEQPSQEMGREATDLLIEEIAQRKRQVPVELFQIQLPTKVVVRESTKKK